MKKTKKLKMRIIDKVTGTVVRTRGPMLLKITEGKEDYAINRVLELLKDLKVPVTLADLMEISPSCKTILTKEMQRRTKLNEKKKN